MFLPLAFLFIFIPAAEIYLLFEVGDEIGGFNTFLIVILTGIMGAALARTQGFYILTKIQTEMGKGVIPSREIIHGLMVFAGGLMLLTPGFMTDIFGFSLVLPGTRHFLYVWVEKLVGNMIQNGNVQFHRASIFNNSDFHNNEDRFHSEVESDVFEAEYTEKKH